MAMRRVEIIGLRIKGEGQEDDGSAEVFPHELKLVLVRAANRKVKIVSRGHQREVDLEAEYSRIKRFYRLDTPEMKSYYGDGPEISEASITEGNAALAKLVKQEEQERARNQARETPHDSDIHKAGLELAGTLEREAASHLGWLVGGTGWPHTSEGKAAADGIQEAALSGRLGILRNDTAEGQQQVYTHARGRVRSMFVSTGPRLRVIGDSQDLPQGDRAKDVASAGIIPGSNPPHDAIRIKAYDEADAHEVARVESVEFQGVGADRATWSREHSVDGSDIIELKWLYETASEGLVTVIEARSKKGATRSTIRMGQPREEGSDPHGAG